MSQVKASYILPLDGMRAIAILLVLVFHIEESFLPGGFIGVDVFFVISGFIITKNIELSVRENRFSFVDFYTMPRRYNDDQYLAGALGMYLTYINLFVFILRLMIALQGGGRRD